MCICVSFFFIFFLFRKGFCFSDRIPNGMVSFHSSSLFPSSLTSPSTLPFLSFPPPYLPFPSLSPFLFSQGFRRPLV
ncbi:hypothetical protein GGR50DRAFT_669580 [Xylaria sp. CBS 124048]|nr:hypothetical protein GGR50DRAFT_669580 [Xylaria sp. CBS 124048]